PPLLVGSIHVQRLLVLHIPVVEPSVKDIEAAKLAPVLVLVPVVGIILAPAVEIQRPGRFPGEEEARAAVIAAVTGGRALAQERLDIRSGDGRISAGDRLGGSRLG